MAKTRARKKKTTATGEGPALPPPTTPPPPARTPPRGAAYPKALYRKRKASERFPHGYEARRVENPDAEAQLLKEAKRQGVTWYDHPDDVPGRPVAAAAPGDDE